MQNSPIADIKDENKDAQSEYGADYNKEKAIAMKAALKKHFKRVFDGETDTADTDLRNFAKRFCVKKNRYHVSLLSYTTNDTSSDFITKFKECMNTVYLKPIKCAYVTWVAPDDVAEAANSVVRIEWVVEFERTEYMSVYKQKIIRALPSFDNKVGSVTGHNVFSGLDIVPLNTDEKWSTAMASIKEDECKHGGYWGSIGDL